MMLRAWKRGFAALLLMTIVSSVAAADRACLSREASAASEGAQHHGGGPSHHGEEEAPVPDRDTDCQMMLTCGSAVSMQASALHIISIAATTQLSIVAPHYTAPHLRQESPPPKSHA